MGNSTPSPIDEKYVVYFLECSGTVMGFEIFANCYENARDLARKISDGRYAAYMVEHVEHVG